MKCSRRTFILGGAAAGLGLIGTVFLATRGEGASREKAGETMLARIDAQRCIGCARCVNVAAEAYRMNPETKKAELIDGAPPEAVRAGARACPVDAVIFQKLESR